MIYFLLDAKSKTIKIGYSDKTVYDRLDNLKLQHNNPLHEVLILQGDKTDEKIYHERFSQYRIKGEWFKYDDEIRDFIINQRSLQYKYNQKSIYVLKTDNSYYINYCDKHKIYNAYNSIKVSNSTIIDYVGRIDNMALYLDILERFNSNNYINNWFSISEDLDTYINSNITDHSLDKTYHNKRCRDYRRKISNNLKENYNENNFINYFELSENSYITLSEIKEYCKKHNLKSQTGKGYLPALKIANYFGLKIQQMTVNNKRIRVINNLRFKKEF